MDKAKIAKLNDKLKGLQDNYGIVAADYVKFQEEFIGKLERLGNEIRAVKGDILREKMPKEEGQ